jgi:hypothetical protein
MLKGSEVWGDPLTSMGEIDVQKSLEIEAMTDEAGSTEERNESGEDVRDTPMRSGPLPSPTYPASLLPLSQPSLGLEAMLSFP